MLVTDRSTYNMEFFKLLIGCVFITLKSATALECYTCQSEPYIPYPGAPTPAPGANNCNDRFNMEGIAKDTCMGRCFANMSTAVTGGFSILLSQRGCMPTDELCFQGCQSLSGPPEDGSPSTAGDGDQGQPGDGPPPGASSQYCQYCCEDNLCNAMPIAETAAQQAPPPVEGSRMCWQCEQTKADATAGSCASDDFNGKGATKVDCTAQCVALKGQNEQGVDSVYRDCDPSGGQICQEHGAECCTEELCNGEGSEESGEDPKSGTVLECYTCESQPVLPGETAPPEATNCNDPFNIEGMAKHTCMGRCFAMLTMTTKLNVTISRRGCMQIGEACSQGCQWRSGPPEDGSPSQFGEAPPGAYGTLCNYCCDDNLCNAMPIAETANQQAPPAAVPVEGSRKCWKCEQTKADATAGSCASDDFNGEGATKVDCNAHCVALKGQNEQELDSVYRGCDDSGGQMCQYPGAECCTEELCNGEGGEEGDGEGGAPAVASSSAAIFVGTLFVILF